MARKKRTQIRTAAGTAQDAFLDRVRRLRADPLVVLPEAVGSEPAPLARLRAKLTRIRQRGRAGFWDRRDRGVLGAVAQALPIADMESAPRLLDAKVGGSRRFFLQRGHVVRACSLGVQNHDDPRALLMAYHGMATRHGLHFFAVPRLWCTGRAARPPAAWLEALGERTGVPLREERPDLHGCGHDGRARVLLRFEDGPALAVCAACGRRAENLHKVVAGRYAGPKVRQPVEVRLLLPGGEEHDPDPKEVAAYRAGVLGEEGLLERGVAAWRGAGATAGAGPAGPPSYVVGDRRFPDQEAFLDALAPAPHERAALAAVTREGHAGAEATVAAVLEAHADRLVAAVAAVLGGGERDAAAFAAQHPGLAPRELVRQAHEERLRRARVADLPDLTGLGPVGAWVDATVRAVRREDRAAGLDRIRRAMERDEVPRAHLVAFVRALGGSMDLEVRFQRDQKEAGEALAPLAQRLLEARGDEYREALRDYLVRSGSGERV